MLGSGTELDPYQVATEADLYAVRNDLDAYYLQTADIVMNYYTNWEPIGNADTPFQGEYDGGGHSISHLVIDRPEEDYVGLFGKAYKAVVPCELKNINMINANVTGRTYVGILAGMSFAKITTLRSSGLVTCTENGAGGLIGYQNELSNNPEGHLSDVADCYSTADVAGTRCSDVYPYASSKLGGLFGRIASWVVSKSFATGSVSAVTTTGDAYDIGAFAGAINNIYSDKWQAVTDCYASGNVTGSTASSGFVGYTYRVHYVNCYSCGQVDADGENVGAFIGRVPNGVPVPTIESCYHDSETTGQSDSYATGKTTAEMKTQSTFIDWDFTDTWEINGGYPTLKWAKTTFPLQTGKDYMLVQEHKGADYTGSMVYAGKNWDYVSTLEEFAKTLHEVAGVSVIYEYGGPIVTYNGQPCSYLCSGITDPTASGGFGSYLSDTKRTVQSLADREAYVNFYYILPALSQVEKPIWVGKVITWKDVLSASYYEVKLYLEGECLDTQLVSPGVQRVDYTYFIENFMPAGNYTCTVQAMASETINKVIYWADDSQATSYNVYLINGSGIIVYQASVALGVQTYDFSSIIPGLPAGTSYFGFAVPVVPEA